MKVLKIDYKRYEFPTDFDNINEFIEFINENLNKFIPLNQFDEDNCVFPYLVREDCKKTYVKFSNIDEISEENATLLSRSEYDKKLTECVAKYCSDCVNYTEDSVGDNLKGHKDKLCLDGTCCYYTKKTGDNDN